MTSGVLVDAIAAGRPVVATAFPHAVELLSSGAGLVVDHDDPDAMALALRRDSHQARAGRPDGSRGLPPCPEPWMVDDRRRVPALGRSPSDGAIVTGVNRALEAPEPNFGHLISMTDERGTFEHALFSEPRPEHGYCTDDMARVLVVATREPERGIGGARPGAAECAISSRSAGRPGQVPKPNGPDMECGKTSRHSMIAGEGASGAWALPLLAATTS